MDFAPVAQLDRVADFESEGCRFESCRARFCNSFAQKSLRFSRKHRRFHQNKSYRQHFKEYAIYLYPLICK